MKGTLRISSRILGQGSRIKLINIFIILLLLSSYFCDEGGQEAKQSQRIIKNTATKSATKLEEKETSVSDNSYGNNLETAKEAPDPQKEVLVADNSKAAEKSLQPKLKEDVSGKVILLYHPINTKSHRNQQNAIAEVCEHYTYS